MSELPNLYRDLMRTVVGDHGGVGEIQVHRAFGAAADEPAVAHIDLVVVPPGSSIGRHRHGADRETYVVLRGTARMHRDGEELTVTAGDVVTNPPFAEHGLVNDSDHEVHLLVYEVAPVHP